MASNFPFQYFPIFVVAWISILASVHASDPAQQLRSNDQLNVQANNAIKAPEGTYVKENSGFSLAQEAVSTEEPADKTQGCRNQFEFRIQVSTQQWSNVSILTLIERWKHNYQIMFHFYRKKLCLRIQNVRICILSMMMQWLGSSAGAIVLQNADVVVKSEPVSTCGLKFKKFKWV